MTQDPTPKTRKREVIYVLWAVRFDGKRVNMGAYNRRVSADADGLHISKRWPGWHGQVERISLPIPAAPESPTI